MNRVRLQLRPLTIALYSPLTTIEQPARRKERIVGIVFVSCSFLLSGLLFFLLS